MVALVVLIAAAGAAAAYRPVLGLAVPVAVVVVIQLIRHLELAALLVIACAPFDRYLNTYINPNAFKAVGVVLLLSFIFNRFNAKPLKRQPLSVAIAVFLGLMLLAALLHPNGALGLQVVQRYLSFGLTALALVSTLQRELAPKLAVAVYAYACTVGAGFATYNFLSGGSARGSGPILDPNDLSYVLVAALPFAIWLSAQRYRAFHLACALVLVAGAASTLSRGGAIAAVAMLALALWRGHIPTGAIVGTLVALVIAVPIVATLASGVLDTALSQKQYIAQTNIDTRALRWHAALEMTQSHPIFGEGPGGFRQNYLVVSNHAEPDEPAPVSHEMYLEVSSELGIPALLAFLSIILLAFRSAGQARYLSRGPDQSLASACSISLLGICVASAFLTEQYYLTLWFVLALSAGLLGRAQLAKRAGDGAVESSPQPALVS